MISAVAILFASSVGGHVHPPEAPQPALVVDFEGTKDGEIPEGFTKQGGCEVTSVGAHRGRKCLQIDPAERGPRRIVLKGDLVKGLGASHWGRLYLKVKTPTPVPVVPPGQNFAVIHSTIVEATGTSPLHHDPIWVRLADTCTGPDGGLQWLYNVEAHPRPEFATGSPFKYRFSGDWTLVEWHVDGDTQTYQLFVDGKEIPEVKLSNGAGNFKGTEIPPFFESLAFGLNNYQPAGAGFTAWIDDIAVGHERIGDARLGTPAWGRPTRTWLKAPSRVPQAVFLSLEEPRSRRLQTSQEPLAAAKAADYGRDTEFVE